MKTKQSENKIHLEKKQFYKYQYTIYSDSTEIGSITFIIQNTILIITFLEIHKEYRSQYYGYQVIEYLLSYYNVNCIIGETLKESRGFWNKCIRKYNGQRKNISYNDDCTSSFVIPKFNMSNEEIYRLLEDTRWY